MAAAQYWVDVLWAAVGGACVVMAGVHLALSRHQRDRASLVFALCAMVVGAISATQLLMMHASPPDVHGHLQRWSQTLSSLLFMGLSVHAWLRFPASRGGLCVAACVTQLAALALSLSEVTAAATWMALASALVLVAQLVDIVIGMRRRHSGAEAAQAARLCGVLAVFVLASAMWPVWAGEWPARVDAIVVPAFLCVLVAVGLDLAGTVGQAAQSSRSLGQAQAALSEREHHMEVAIRAAEIGTWDWDMRTETFHFSPLALEILGVRDGQRFDRDEVRSRIHPDDLARVQHALESAMRDGADYRAEYRIRSDQDSGEWRWIASRGQLEVDEAGGPRGLRGIVADITERKQIEEHFQLAVEAAPTAMLMVDGSGRITLCNLQAQALFGYPRCELLGLPVDALVPEHSRPQHAHHRQQFGRDASARAMGVGRELNARHKDGELIPVEITLTPLRVRGQHHVLASVNDIRRRRQLEREAALNRDELAHLSRVAMLAELSGSLAHELNQPLTAILSNAQAALRFLGRDPPDLEEVRESLVYIVESDRRAGEVIRRLRAMLKREAPEHVPLDLNEVVGDVLRIVHSDLINRNTQVALDLGASLPSVDGDRVQLQQVLLNLLMNGCDAMAKLDTVRELTVRTRAVGEGVEVSVADRGPGIPDADLERVFSPFFTTKKEGLGLGLAVCTTIVEWTAQTFLDISGAIIHGNEGDVYEQHAVHG